MPKLKPGKCVVIRSQACNMGKFVTAIESVGIVEFEDMGGKREEMGWLVEPSLPTWDGGLTDVVAESQLENVDESPPMESVTVKEYCRA